jgi:23S rRNA G2445 N2-methylase RlmL
MELEQLRAQDQREIKALKKELKRKEKAMAEMAPGFRKDVSPAAVNAAIANVARAGSTFSGGRSI